MTTPAELIARPFGHRCRAAGLGVLLGLALVGAAAVTARVLADQTGTLLARPRLSVDDAVPLVALAVLVCGLLWLALLVAVSSREALRHTPQRHPASVPAIPGTLTTRVAGLLLALTAFGSVGAPGGAGAQPLTTVSAESGSNQTQPSPGAPVPDFAAPQQNSTPDAPSCRAPEPGWSTGAPGLQRRATTDQAGLLDRCAARSGGEVVVHRGDSLWSIVERELGADAGPQEVAARWPEWYAANRDAIGSDPDLLLPGTVLHRPTPEVVR